MLGTQQFYHTQFPDQTAWTQNTHHGGNHAQAVQNPLSHMTSKGNASSAQQQQYQILHQNHNQNTPPTSATQRSMLTDATDATSLSMLTNQPQQGPPHMDQLSEDNQNVLIWVSELLRPDTRESALMELSKKREQVPELALILWHSFGVMTSLLQEIISVYPLLNPSQLTAAASNRVCNALALLQCVASHGETRSEFLNAHILLFLYPFLNTTSKSRPFEYLRLTSLGVVGALVKNEPNTSASVPSTTPGLTANPAATTPGGNAVNSQTPALSTNSSPTITFLLSTEIIPLCLRIMETGSELSKTVAIFIVQKILLDDVGLSYICATYERFYAVGTVLSNMTVSLVEDESGYRAPGQNRPAGGVDRAQGCKSVRLLKHVVRCFLRLSDNGRARMALRQCLPVGLRDGTFSGVLRDDAASKRCLAQLLVNLSDESMPNQGQEQFVE